MTGRKITARFYVYLCVVKKAAKYSLIIVFALAFTAFVACLVSGAYFVRIGLRPEVKFDQEAEIAKLSEKYPGLTEWVEEMISSGNFRDTSIIIDSLEKHAYLISAADTSFKTAVTVHGYTSNPIHMMPYAKMFWDMGYNVILPHLHYHALSQGDAIQMGWNDRLDVIKWMDVAHNRFNDTLMVVHGVSMGGATTMMVSGEDLPDYVKGFVEDCGYTSAWDEFSHELKKRYGLGEFPVLYSADLVCWLKYGWHFKEASSVGQLAKCKLPMLFIHGDQDNFVPYYMLEQNFNSKIEGYREMWTVPGVAHANSFRTFPEEYTSRVEQFLKEHVE